jgi:zinc protease
MPEGLPSLRLPRAAERITPSGLRTVAVRRAGVPLVELRLRVPLRTVTRRQGTRTVLLGESFFSGTTERSAAEVAAALQALGGALHASVDADALTVSGSALASELRGLLRLLSEVLTGNAYPPREVATHRARLAEQVLIARSQPDTLAREAAARRLFGAHPYGFGLPEPEEVRSVEARELRGLHERAVRATGAVLVLVGDVAPARALDTAEEALGAWAAAPAEPPAVPPPAPFVPGGLVQVERAGALQTNVRLVGPAPSRVEAGYPSLVLANTVFGGYFSSRLVANIREDKGYTYSPHSALEHAEAASSLVVAADVETDATAPAVLETLYELGRMATAAVGAEELDAARRYLLGALALSLASQAGLASTLSMLAAVGLDLAWLDGYARALTRATPEEVLDASRRWLAPSRLALVCVGDGSRYLGELEALGYSPA